MGENTFNYPSDKVKSSITNMRIGIITFWTSKDNYGQILQCFALQQYLRNKGQSPFLIRYKDTPRSGASFKWSRIFKYVLKLPTYVSWFFSEKKKQHNASMYQKAVSSIDRHFEKFLKENVDCTEQIYTEDTIHMNPPLADAYMCGSDQIWGGDWAYYLDFAPDEKPKIAYAPSLGGIRSFSQAYEDKMRTLLKRFAFVGMREQTGVEVCHRLGRKDAVKVVDPTLLLTRADYDRVRINTKTVGQKPYLFAYILGNPMSCDMRDVYDYARKHGLDVKYATSGKADNYEHVYPQIGEWIDLIANAEIIVTNSFHGTVFSLIYNKPFITILLNDGFERMNTRVLELLECAGLKNRIYNGNFEEIQLNADFSNFEEYRLKEEHKSYSYILNCIEK